eukprot:4899284-Pyramimonas_sp.AAC.1
MVRFRPGYRVPHAVSTQGFQHQHALQYRQVCALRPRWAPPPRSTNMTRVNQNSWFKYIATAPTLWMNKSQQRQNCIGLMNRNSLNFKPLNP